MTRNIRSCVVCGKPCVGRVCREHYESKSNTRHYGSGIRPSHPIKSKEDKK